MIGSTISHYKILSKLGEGGMGVVYKAEDTKLDRLVALKFLPTRSLGSEEDRKRFEQEAKAAAALNHPNIATIYEINEYEGDTFIAMEYVDGVTLTEKIKEGPLKIKNAMNIAKQVADGLNAAHEKGIFHRDIKSSNIMLTKKNQVKILDFGLAKIKAGSMVTKPGTMLGTIACMSPEQARGEEVDHRTDIWSLGVIFYEMISGQLPFKGEYESAMIYSIMNLDPEPLTGLRTGVPMDLEKIINKLLEKDPDDRYQNVIELPVDLKAVDLKSIGTSQITTTAAMMQPARKPKFWQRVDVLYSAIIMAIVLTFLAVWYLKPEPTQAPKHIEKFIINPPAGEEFNTFNGINISPDGESIVYTASSSSGTHLYLRKREQFEATQIPGTDGASYPFFSYDGSWIGFSAGGMLMKVPLLGGAPMPICKVGSNFAGATWSHDDTIIWGSLGSGLMQVAAIGGTPKPITTPEGNTSHRWPEILPGSKALIFTIWPNKGVTFRVFNSACIAVLDLESGEWWNLIEGGSCPRYAPSIELSIGHIIYARTEGLVISLFDTRRLETQGLLVPVLGNVSIESNGSANFDFSSEGKLVYLPGGISIAPKRTLVWVDPKGNPTPLTEKQNPYTTPRISPNGKLIAVDIADNMGVINIWIFDTGIDRFNQLTFVDRNSYPVWDIEGKRIAFSSTAKSETSDIFWKPADGSREAERILEQELNQNPGSWSYDGKLLAYYHVTETSRRDIWVLNIQDGKSSVFLNTEANEVSPMFSPVGQWLAYGSDEEGQYEVYVQPYPPTGAKYFISIDEGSGIGPVWAPKGNMLYYRNGDKMMAVEIQMEPQFKPGAPYEVFKGQYLTQTFRPAYDIHPDGNRFLMVTQEESNIRQINVVVNWFEELKEKFRTEKK